MADNDFTADSSTDLEAKAAAIESIGENAEKTASQMENLTASNWRASDAATKASQSQKDLAKDISNVGNTTKLTNDIVNSSSESFSAINNIVLQSQKAFQGITSTLDSFMNQFQEINNLTNAQQTAFTGLNTLAVGVRESFDSLSNVDVSGLTLMKDEASSFINKIKNDIAGGATEKALDGISKLFGKAIGDEAVKHSNNGAAALNKFLDTLVTGVDNVRRLTNAQIQLAAATGSLDEMFEAAGPNLIDLNDMLDTQHASLLNLSSSYGISNKVLEQYYSMLGKIPGALTDNVQGYDSATDNISALNGSLLLATGSGRSFADVTSDMHQAIRNYGLNSDEAITFTSRISEITNNYGLELEDVRSRLLDVARGFKFFGNEAEGAATLVNQYVNAIKETGVSGNVALDIVGQMTDGIKNLTLAQKSFISAQTGGAGGLVGAFQIEKDLREGKLDEVFEKVRETMQKQMGEIISLDEAAMSPEAAARFTKQIQILRQGPLGQFAENDQAAMRILEGFQKLQSGEDIVKDLDRSQQETGMTSREKLMEVGNTILQRNNDALTQLNRTLERQQQLNNLGIYNTSQRALGGVAVNRSQTAEEMARINTMRQAQQSAQIKASQQTSEFINVMSGEEGVVNRSGERMLDVTRETTNFATEIAPEVFKSMAAIGKDVVNNLDVYNSGAMTDGERNSKINELTQNAVGSGLSESQFRNMAARAMSGDQQSKKQLDLLSKGPITTSLTEDQMAQLAAKSTETVPMLLNGEMSATKLPAIDWQNIPENLAAQAYQSANTLKNTATSHNMIQPINQVQNQDGTITVKVEGICIECNKKTHSSHGQTQGLANRP